MDERSGPTSRNRPAEDEIHLRDVWNLLVRNWLLIGTCLIVVVGAVAAYTFYVIPVYQAETSIRVEEAQNNQQSLSLTDLLNGNEGNEVNTEQLVLESRTVAEATADSLDLQVSVARPRGVARSVLLGSLSAERWAPEGEYVLTRQSDSTFSILEKDSAKAYGSVSTTRAAALPGVTFLLKPAAETYDRIVIDVTPFKKTVASLQKALTVSIPDQNANIITVSYESTDTVLVHKVLNALATLYIRREQGIQKTQARSTVEFLDTQIDTLQSQLLTAEDTLTRFQQSQQVISPQAEADAQVTQLASLEAQRNQIDAQRGALQSLVDEVEKEASTANPSAPSPYVRLISFPTLFANQATSEELQALNNANNERSQLLTKRTMEDPDVVQLTHRIHQIEAQLRSTALTYLDGLTKQVQSYDKTLSAFKEQLEAIPLKEVEYDRLSDQVATLKTIYQTLENDLQQNRVLEAVNDASIRVVDPAILPAKPVKPRKLLNLVLALVLGSMLGVGVAFMREYMDDTIHTREDIQASGGGVPILGLIPRIRVAGGMNGRGKRAPEPVTGAATLGARLVAGRDPRSPVAEAYRSLRTNLTFSNPDQPPRTIVFTSPMPQDGKSTSTANLAITLAQQGHNILLIDADLRRGILHSVFGVERDPGLTTVLSGGCEIDDAVRRLDLGESGIVHFLPSGPYPPNPAEVLGSKKMRALIESLQERFEMIAIDSPPLTAVTDAALLGTNADGVVLVARANNTEKGALAYAVEQLANVRAPVLGAILNDVDYRRDSRYRSTYGKYGYYHQYYYSTQGRRRSSKGSGEKA